MLKNINISKVESKNKEDLRLLMRPVYMTQEKKYWKSRSAKGEEFFFNARRAET